MPDEKGESLEMRVLLHQPTLLCQSNHLGIHSSGASALAHSDAVIFDGRILKFSMIDHMTIRCKLVSATSILPDAGSNDNCVVLHV